MHAQEIIGSHAHLQGNVNAARGMERDRLGHDAPGVRGRVPSCFGSLLA